jgi:tetratricopeptide (TPR) repeat protein
MPSRIPLLEGFIKAKPTDPFPRYALALEHKNAGNLEEAWRVFEALMAAHADYTPAYLHAGNTLVSLGRTEEAKVIYARGVDVSARVGDGHAAGELQQALGLLG